MNDSTPDPLGPLADLVVERLLRHPALRPVPLGGVPRGPPSSRVRAVRCVGTQPRAKTLRTATVGGIEGQPG